MKDDLILYMKEYIKMFTVVINDNDFYLRGIYSFDYNEINIIEITTVTFDSNGDAIIVEIPIEKDFI